MASAALVLASLSGCSLVVDTKAEQCATDADCAGRGAGFTCTARGVCAAPVAAARCTSNAACTAASDGVASVCRAATGACVKLVSPDCPRVLGDVASDDTVVLGSILPIGGEFAETGVPVANSVELAMTDILQVTNGLPPLAGSNARRPIALVECDESKDPVQAARHLSVELGVPGIVGPFGSGAALRVATDVTIPNGTFMISPGATAPSLSSLSAGKLVWRTAPSDVYQAMALTALVPVVERDHRREWEIPASENIKVAMIVRGDNFGLELADTVLSSGVTFNGKSAAANGDALFARRDYADPASGAEVDYAKLVDFLIQYHPNIVILLTGPEGVTRILASLEATWPQGAGAPPKPWFILAHPARTDALSALLKGNEDLRRRVRGTQGGVKNALYDSFIVRYRSAYPAAEVFGMPNAYDAGFLLAYGIVGSNGPPTGASIGEAFKRFVGGSPAPIGVTNLASVLDTLRGGGSVAVSGASGPLAFDVTKGEAPANVDVWCAARQGTSAVLKSSGTVFDVNTKTLVGAFDCPQ